MTFKRFLALLLVLCTLGSLVTPAAAQAAEDPQTTLDSSNMAFTGTNSFGNLLAAEISTHQLQEETAEAGFSVTDLSFSGSTATVTYSALREALLVVAVYTENGLQLLCSGKTTVSPDETTAKVTVQGNMPEYFYAGAYLLDATDYVPLCEEYTTPMYTREMRELLASTVDSYDPEKVYNLDDDRTTNFAVFAEDTIVIDEQPGVNTVASVDDTNKVYVIENSDETITSLQPGDVLAYPYGDGDILIVKVASLSVSGTTATISGTDMEIDEVFQAVKINSGANTSDFSVDTGNLAEGVTYLGTVQSPGNRSISGSETAEDSFAYTIEEDALSGSLNLTLGANVEFYVSMYRQYLDVTVDGNASVTLTLSGKKEYQLSIGKFGVAPVPGLYIAVEPTAIYRFDGNITFTYGYDFMLGFSAESRGGIVSMQNRSSTPVLRKELKFQGSVFIGFDLNPQIDILSEAVLNTGMHTVVGLELSGTLEYNYDEPNPDKDIIHSCSSCVDGTITVVVELTVYAQFLGNDEWNLDETILDYRGKLGKFYWSTDEGTYDLTACPHRFYRVSVEVTDASNVCVPGASVTVSTGESAVAGANGVAVFYLPAGEFSVSTVLDGTVHDVTFYVKHMPRKVTLSPNARDEEQPCFTYGNSDIFVDANSVLGYGSWGNTVYWSLYGDGTMHIYGEGGMPICTDPKYIPWHKYRSYITSLVVDEGVTAVGAYTFYGCQNLREVILPDGLQQISNRSFEGCSALEAIVFPSSLKKIEDNSFNGCVKLTEVTVPCNLGNHVFQNCTGLKQVKLLEGVTSIGALAFCNCVNITELTLPDSLTIIYYRAFENCYNLREICIPGSVKDIGHNAFRNCNSLERAELQHGVEKIASEMFDDCEALREVIIPETVTTIGSYAFRNCTSLQEVTVPAITESYAFIGCISLEKVAFTGSVTSIGMGVFKDCSSLSEVIIPDSVTSIGKEAFIGCTGLTEITLPHGITTLPDSLFNGCTGLRNFVISESVTSIGAAAFNGCISLTEITIPNTVTYLGGSAFKGCTGLRAITIPASVKSYGNYVFEDCVNLERINFEDGLTSIGYGMFQDCTGLRTVAIPESVTSIDAYAFQYCTGLSEITLPSRITKLNTGLFRGCTSLNGVIIPEKVETIRNNVFYDCTALTEITIPASVLSIEAYAFYQCRALKSIIFRGNPTTIGRAPFYRVIATAYYPADNTKWTAEQMKKYGSDLTWVPYTLDESGNMVINEAAAMTVTPSGEAIPEEALTVNAAEEVPSPTVEEVIPEEAPVLNTSLTDDLVIEEKPEEDISPDAIFGGDYSSEVIDNSYILKTASFTGLVPGEEYVMLALVSTEAADILAANNLLGILQGTAEADGTLQFRYVQRVNTDISYVVACGASNKNLADATITFPEMKANESLQAVDPTVVYNGITLTEGVDYEITGTVSFTDPGTYTCTIRGIHNYTGALECTYTVKDGTLPGDVNSDEKADSIDACLVMLYYSEQLELTEDQLPTADMDGNGIVDLADAYAILLRAN